jgi:hypothetical protein
MTNGKESKRLSLQGKSLGRGKVVEVVSRLMIENVLKGFCGFCGQDLLG